MPFSFLNLSTHDLMHRDTKEMVYNSATERNGGSKKKDTGLEQKDCIFLKNEQISNFILIEYFRNTSFEFMWHRMAGLGLDLKSLILSYLYDYKDVAQMNELCQYIETNGWKEGLISMVRYSTPDELANIFKERCSAGDLGTCRVISEHRKLSPDVAIKGLKRACSNNHLLLAQWLTKSFEISMEDDPITARFLIYQACHSNFLVLAQWLYKTFGLVFNQSQDKIRFVVFCRGGKDVAQWLVTSVLTRAEVKSNANLLFAHACNNENRDFVEWIYQEFKLTQADVPVINDIFHNACGRGDLEQARWLHVTFAFRPKDVMESFRYACESGQLDVAKWLDKNFNLTREDVCSREHLAFRLACYGGHLKVAL